MKAIFCLGVVLAGSLSGPVLAGGEIKELRNLASDGMVVVRNPRGEVEVTGWDRDEVSILGELGAGASDLLVEGSDRRLQVEVIYPRNKRDIEESILEIRIPRGASLAVDTTSGDILVEGLEGDLIELRSVSGDLEIDGGRQRVIAHAVSGDIDIESSARRVELNAVSGDIDAEVSSVEADVETVSGEILFKSGALERARFETVSGDMELDIEVAENGSVTVASLNGDIDLILPRSLSATCEAESFSGTIKSTRGEVEKAKYGPHKVLRFVAGEGAGRVQVESFSGDVRIRDN